MSFITITILCLIIGFFIYRWYSDRECGPGTSKWNSGGLTDTSTCKCPYGYGWGASGCQECPYDTYTDGNGGESDIRGCKCIRYTGWNSTNRACIYCLSNTSPTNTGPPDEPGSGCFCPTGMTWNSDQCKCM